MLDRFNRLAETLSCPDVAAMPPFEQFQIPAQDLQHVIEIVRHAAGQFAERLHLLRLKQRGTRLFELFVGVLSLGHVACDLGETDQLPLFIADCVDDDVCPELAAVFPDAPSLGFETPFGRGGGETASRQTFSRIFRCIEPAEMRPNDFVRLIPLDARGAEIPVGYMPFGRQHEDRVIGHALDQQPEAPLAIDDSFIGEALVRRVAYDLAEADECAVWRVKRRDEHAGPEPCAVLAYVPALSVVLPGPTRDVQSPLRDTAAPVLLRVENGEIPADYFTSLVALDASGAGVPASYFSLRGQPEDRVFRNAPDQGLHP